MPGLIHGLLARDNCIPCPDVVPPCNCAADQICQQTATTCTSCATVQCIANTSSNSGGSGGPPGALIGAIVAVVVVVGLVCVGVFYYRRRALARAKRDEPVQIKDVPAPAAAVLSRPDPSEKAASLYSSQGAVGRRLYSPTNGTIDLDPDHPAVPRASTSHVNPFEDARSIQTASTSTHGGTNIIPIELVPAGSNSVIQSLHSPTSPTGSSSHIPSRPPRSPELSLNENHNFFPDGSARGPASQISGISGHSLGSYASYSSDFLNESPTIVTGTRGVRQVLGVGKAELVRTPSTTSAGSGPARPSVRSPLANSSFGPHDVLMENMGSPDSNVSSNPFSDRNNNPHAIAPGINQYPPTPLTNEPTPKATEDARNAFSYVMPPTPNDALNSGISTPGNLRSPYGDVKTDSDTTPRAEPNTFAAQQDTALLHANTDAKTQHRGSIATNASGLSQADTILDGFSFVPPSGVSPVPPRPAPAIPPVPKIPNVASPTTADPLMPALNSPLESGLLSPDGQTARVFSTASNSGLSPFTFDIPPIPETPQQAGTNTIRAPHPLASSASNLSPQSPSSSGDPKSPRKRSSLDTLALLSDLHSYPLGFDKKK